MPLARYTQQRAARVASANNACLTKCWNDRIGKISQMFFGKISLPEDYPISHVFSHRKELCNSYSADKKVTNYIGFQAELVRRLSTNQFMQSFPIRSIERHLPLFRKRMFLINNGPQPTMEAARLAWSNRKLRSGSKSENARRNDAIYDRERRTTKRRKKRKNQQRI